VLERVACRYKVTFATTISRKRVDIRGQAISLIIGGPAAGDLPAHVRLRVVCALPVLRVTGAVRTVVLRLPATTLRVLPTPIATRALEWPGTAAFKSTACSWDAPRGQGRPSNTELHRYVRDFSVLYQSALHWRNDILNKLPKVVFVTCSAVNLHEAQRSGKA